MRWNVFIFSSLRSKWNTKRHCWGVVTISRYFKRKKVKTFVSMCRMRDAFSFDCWLILIAICQFCQQQPNFKCYFLAIIRPPSRQFTLSLSLRAKNVYFSEDIDCSSLLLLLCWKCSMINNWVSERCSKFEIHRKYPVDHHSMTISNPNGAEMLLSTNFFNEKINTRYLHKFRPFHKRTAVAISLFLVDFIYLFVLHFSIIFNS